MKALITINEKLPFHILSCQSCSVSIVQMSQRRHFSCDSLTKKRRNGLTMKSLRSYLVLLITSLHTVILQVVLLELSLLVFAYLYSEYSIKGRLMLRLANFCINLTTALPLTYIVTQRGYICMYVL